MSTINHDFDKLSENIESRWDTLRKSCCDNLEYFAAHPSSVKLKDAILLILEQLNESEPLYDEIARLASQFDFDEKTPGNGYRSFLLFFDKCITHTEHICRKMYRQRNSMFSRKDRRLKEIEVCCQLLITLHIALQHLKTMDTWATQIMSDKKLPPFVINRNCQELFNFMKNFNQYCFYDRFMGFQFCNSIKKILKLMTSAIVSYSEKYYNSGTIFERCANCIKYLSDPEAKAYRMVELFQYTDIYFIEAIASLPELKIPVIICSLVVNKIISIPPEELIVSTLDGETISIPIPNSHIGKKPISIRLLSSKRRLGMIGSENSRRELHNQCDSLIIFIHGGGFIARASQMHKMFLHKWVTMLGVPIVCIDYSLLPQASYPRMLEEVVYAYAWILKNASTLLGSTAKKVIVVGESAGGVLSLNVTLKCLHLNIRKPDGVFTIYTPIFLNFTPLPSHILLLTDPILSFGIVMRCLKAYAGAEIERDIEKLTEKHENEELARKSNSETSVEMREDDITLAPLPNADGANNESKLTPTTSDSMLNTVNLTKVDVSSHITENSSVNRNNDIPDQSGNLWSRFKRSLCGRNNKNVRHLDIKSSKTYWEEIQMTLSNDPFINPYLISDDILVHFPPMKILTVDLDPLLDSSVIFAKRLRSLGNKVTLDILPDLPHGFLYFFHVSKEAKEGVKFCARRIQELLEPYNYT